MSDTSLQVTDNPAASRFEVTVDSVTAFLEYRRTDTQLALVHTEVPPEIGGRGVAFALARHGFEAARAGGRRVVPLCRSVQVFLKRHPEYGELVGR